MITIDKLCHDVLDLIFRYLFAHDLCSVALVSHSFSAAAIPRLYHTLSFRRRQALRFKEIKSPFAVILSRLEYVAHVRAIDVRAIPIVNSKPHPHFIREFEDVMRLCNKLQFFTCTTKLLNCMPHLKDQKYLHELRIVAPNFSDLEASYLLDFGAIRSLVLVQGSWNVLNILPKWSTRIRETLTSLELYACSDLNETILESTLCQLTRLSALHIARCPEISVASVLQLTRNMPALQSLSIDIVNVIPSTLVPAYFPSLRRLSFNIYGTDNQKMNNLSSVSSYFHPLAPSLSEISIRCGTTTLQHGVITKILQDYAETLKTFACHSLLQTSSINSLCGICSYLEELVIPLPMREFATFVVAARQLKKLRTLHNVTLPQGLHMTGDKVKRLMLECPELNCVISGKRVWMKCVNVHGSLNIKCKNYGMDGDELNY